MVKTDGHHQDILGQTEFIDKNVSEICRKFVLESKLNKKNISFKLSTAKI